MKVSMKEFGDVVVFSVNNSVLQEHVSILANRLDDAIKSGKVKIVINMLLAEYLSSVSLATIIDAKRNSVAAGGNLVMANVNHLILNLLEVTNLRKAIDVYSNVEDAIEFLKQM